MISFVETALDSGTPDTEAMMVLRDGYLLAIVSRLSSIHGVLEGRWFLEASFRSLPHAPDLTFETIAALERWFGQIDAQVGAA